MIPKSLDLLGVYNGKGTTREAAILSAVMEAVERQAGAEVELPTAPMRVRDVLEFVDLRAAGIREEALDSITPCVAATELLSGQVVPMPLAMVQCPWYGEKLFASTTSNGLASGNNVIEAIYHALSELIERHVWSLFAIRSQLVPKFFLGENAPDAASAREVLIPTGLDSIDALIEQVHASGMSLRILALEEPPLPVVAIAGITEARVAQPIAHSGLGCSPSARHAIARAITEAVQSRVTDIQAAREDIKRPDDLPDAFGEHTRRQTRLPKGRWYFDLPAPTVAVAELPEQLSEDLAADVRSIVTSLCTYGIERMYVVQIPAIEGVSVVRAIVPQLERTTVDGTIGSYGRREFNPFFIRS